MTDSAEPADEQPQQSTAELPSHSDSGELAAQPVQRTMWKWATLAAALIAVVATGVAIWALSRPSSDAPSTPTAQQVDEAKGRACDAYGTVRAAVALQTQANIGTDPIAVQAVAANARLAMAVGGQHLVDNLSPAVPPELAGLMRSLATDLQNLTINALAGTAADERGQLERLEANSAKIVDSCK